MQVMQKKNQNFWTLWQTVVYLTFSSLAAVFSELAKIYQSHPQFFQLQTSFDLNDLEFRGLDANYEKII